MPNQMTFGTYLEEYPEGVRKIALNLRVLILKLLPRGVIETVHPGMKWITYGIPKSILAIKPGTNEVKLFFFEGVQLDNKIQLLKGSGSRLRFISIKNVDNLKEQLSELIEQAYDLEKKKKVRKSKI